MDYCNLRRYCHDWKSVWIVSVMYKYVFTILENHMNNIVNYYCNVL